MFPPALRNQCVSGARSNKDGRQVKMEARRMSTFAPIFMSQIVSLFFFVTVKKSTAIDNNLPINMETKLLEILIGKHSKAGQRTSKLQGLCEKTLSISNPPSEMADELYGYEIF